jgi:hypothetical protein
MASRSETNGGRKMSDDTHGSADAAGKWQNALDALDAARTIERRVSSRAGSTDQEKERAQDNLDAAEQLVVELERAKNEAFRAEEEAHGEG